MEHTDKQQQAFEIFFQTDLSQQQIAEMLGINRKTLYLWIKEGGWKRAKYAATHAPGILMEQYYAQLGAINQSISERTERPYPTKEEADIIRKLSTTIKTVNTGIQTVGECVQVFHAFTDRLRRTNLSLTKQLLPHMTSYIKELTEEGQWLYYSEMRRSQAKFDKEYGEWVTQNPAQEEVAPTTDTHIPTPADIPATAPDPTPPPQSNNDSPTPLPEKNGASNGALGNDLEIPNPLSDNALIPLIHNPEPSENIFENGKSPIELAPPAPANPEPKTNTIPLPSPQPSNDTHENQTPEIPLIKTGAYYATLPVSERPSPFREGNIVWVNNIGDINPDEIKMCDSSWFYKDVPGHAA